MGMEFLISEKSLIFYKGSIRNFDFYSSHHYLTLLENIHSHRHPRFIDHSKMNQLTHVTKPEKSINLNQFSIWAHFTSMIFIKSLIKAMCLSFVFDFSDLP
jgi:hypothetical protein